MKKIKKNNKFTASKLIAIFIISLAVISIGYSRLGTTLELSGKSSFVTETSNSNFKIEYEKNAWGANPTTYQFNVKVTNVSGSPVDNWNISVPVPADTKIAGFWNVKAEIVDGKLILSNEGYNGNLGIDASVSFGLQLTTSKNDFELNEDVGGSSSTEEEEKPGGETDDSGNTGDDSGNTGGDSGNTGDDSGSTEGDSDEKDGIKNVSITYSEQAKWSSGDKYNAMYKINIENISDKTINSWTLKINKTIDVSYVIGWNINYIEQDDLLILSNVGYNGKIEPGKSVSVQFQVLQPKDYQPTTKSIIEVY